MNLEHVVLVDVKCYTFCLIMRCLILENRLRDECHLNETSDENETSVRMGLTLERKLCHIQFLFKLAFVAF